MLTQIEKKLLRFINKDELVRLTQELIRIDSVIRPETGNTEAGVVRYIADWIRRELGVEPLIETGVPARENIIVTIDSGRPGPCLVNGPGPRHVPHQTDEYVQIDELFESLQIYLLTTLRFLNQ